jgi:thiol-disulfide isomerase/thioredoxin
MTIRTSSTKFASVALAIAALLAIAEVGPSKLSSKELNLSDHGPAPVFAGSSTWLNSPPLTVASLKGKVVLVQFWTYTCINWMRTLPYVTRWYDTYKDRGFIVIGVHTPEFAFEKETSNVEAAIKRSGITYPVPQDNQFGTWKAYRNYAWPAEYLIDKSGKIVAIQLGEGNYGKIEKAIARLVGDSVSDIEPDDPGLGNIGSPEMYFGTEQNVEGVLKKVGSSAIVSSQSAGAGERVYTAPDDVPLNRFAFSGTWKISADNATLLADDGELLLRFRAPKVNLVAGSSSSQILSITVDDKPQPPVTVQGSQLYSLYSGTASEHVLRLKIPKAGLSAFTFSFG